MGNYIEVPEKKNKARQILNGEALVRGSRGWVQAPPYDATLLRGPMHPAELLPGQALICVVDNGIFEAAAWCPDQDEYKAFTDPQDTRPKEWLLMDRATVLLCTTEWNDA